MTQQSPWKRSVSLLTPSRSTLVIVDVQERLLPLIERRDSLVSTIRFLLDVAAVFQVRTVVTEQYPRGLGPTVSLLAGHTSISSTLEKLRFSAAEVLDRSGILRLADEHCTPQVVLTGIEAHICVQQTAVDLVAQGFAVFLVADATGSRHSADYLAALQRMENSGVTVTTAEAIAFEWCEMAGSEQFKTLSRLVKERDAASDGC